MPKDAQRVKSRTKLSMRAGLEETQASQDQGQTMMSCGYLRVCTHSSHKELLIQAAFGRSPRALLDMRWGKKLNKLVDDRVEGMKITNRI